MPLIAVWLVAALWLVVVIVDGLGFMSTAWVGYWGMITYPTSTPFVDVIEQPQRGLAADQAGIRAGDRIDLREQSFEARVGLFAQPFAHRPIDIVIHRAGRRMTVTVRPTTIWENLTPVGVVGTVVGAIYGAWFLGCSLLIILRRSWSPEARILSLILIGLGALGGLVFAAPGPTLAMWSISGVLNLSGPALLLVMLSSRSGSRSKWRALLEAFAYLTIALNIAAALLSTYGVASLRFDPRAFGAGAFGGGWNANEITASLAPILLVLVAAAAVASTMRGERPRTAWLLLPLPLTMLAGDMALQAANFDAPWIVNYGTGMVVGCIWLVGGLVVTYAVLKRRVLDFEFVLGRTVVVAVVSLIVVSAFVLLEWLLGTVLAGVSHLTGFVANAALALVLGLSLRYIHRRVDAVVDATLFRKRHEDERALLDFAREAAYVTDAGVLLDLAIERIKAHTDARGAAILVESDGRYQAVRAFGDDGGAGGASENDPLIIALKAWHRPLDPHRQDTALRGALALPMLARGRLRGALLLGERTGGESYAPDEVEALSQFAHGVGSAFEALVERRDDGIASLRDGLISAIASMQDAIISELRAQPRAAG